MSYHGTNGGSQDDATARGWNARCPRLGWLLAVAVLAMGCGGVASAGEVRKDIEYGRAGDARLLLDAHVPDGNGPFPVAILVHGGGWSGGDKGGSNRPGDGADISPWFEALSGANYTWFSINYRLAPEHVWPACMQDVETAIRWVKAHAGEYKGDPNRIALFGHSAGGHLVMFAATAKDPGLRVQAAVGFAPVTDLLSDTERRGGASTSLQKLFGVTKELTPETRTLLMSYSPVKHIHPQMPPVLIVHGDADATVPLAMSTAFIARLQEAGVPARLITRPAVPHSLVKGEAIDPSYRAPMLEWLRATLAPGGDSKR